jgi:PAS domain S-box-containing protein
LASVRTILVVGASDVRRASHAALLSHAGHETVEAASPDEALAIVAANQPPLVIVDSGSDDLAGADLCHRIRQASPETFILQISSTFADDPAAVGEDGHHDAYLVDPIDPRELIAMVRSLLRLQKVEADLRDSEERLLLAQDAAGLAILDWVVDTNTFVHSDNLLELFDIEMDPGAALEPTQLIDRIHPEDIARLIEQFTKTAERSETFETEFRIVRGDGGVHWIASRGRFFLAADGTPQRMLSLSSDVTDRKAAERGNAELASIVATSIDAIVSVDLAGNATSWNAGAERLFAMRAEEIIGKPFRMAFPEVTPAEDDRYRAQLADGGSHEFDIRQKLRDGETRDLWVTSSPMREADGRVIGSSFILRDVTPQKQREDHVRFLMRELTHRSKNLLAVIQAMARQSLTSGLPPEEFVRRFGERLAALAGSHDLLSSVDYKGASLMELIRSQLNHYEDLFGSRILLKGVDVLLRPEAAQNIGIALHELSTNASKYGALSNDKGTVTITWGFSETTPRRFQMSWRETGGPPVAAPTRKGFGTIVMDRTTGTGMGGKSAVTFEPTGVVWSIDVPASGAALG